MATLSKSSFLDATIGVAFSDAITIIPTICAGTTVETFVSVSMTAVTPSLATGIAPGLCPGFPVGGLTYVPTATPSNSPILTINGTFNETYFDEREWEYRDDTTGDANHIPIIELQSTMSDPAGRIYNVTKDSVQEPYASGGQFEDEIPNPCDTLIRYKPDFRSQRQVTYTYRVTLTCAGVPFTQTLTASQTILNNWDLGRDKMKDILANKIRYGT